MENALKDLRGKTGFPKDTDLIQIFCDRFSLGIFETTENKSLHFSREDVGYYHFAAPKRSHTTFLLYICRLYLVFGFT